MSSCGIPKGYEDQCCLNKSGWCTLDTAEYRDIDRAAAEKSRCGFIGVNDRYLLWKYGVPYKDLNCGNCAYYKGDTRGECRNKAVKTWSGAKACKEFKVNCFRCVMYESHRCCNHNGKACPDGLHYEEYTGSTIRQCLYATVEIFQDGYMHCPIIETITCVECMEDFGDGSGFLPDISQNYERKPERRKDAYMKPEQCDSCSNEHEGGCLPPEEDCKAYIKKKEGEVKQNMIKFIPIKKLWPNHYNPRKNLGDLTELAESIKVSGVLQNLTVVPYYSYLTGVGCDDPKQQEEMGYTVVIGHRRLAAAKMAGLTELPCVIVEMEIKEQVATMLLENIQRNELTLWEQAQGFQQMLDLGDSVTNISTHTGFSDTTIRRRLKLLELDKDKFQASMGRGATLQDYQELDKIEDPKLKNKVLEKIGTNNFTYELQAAIDSEKREKNLKKIIEQIKTFAVEISSDQTSEKQSFRCFYPSNTEMIEKPNDAGKVKYYYTADKYGATLYKDLSTEKKEQDDKLNQEKLERDNKRNVLAAKSKLTYMCRRDFIFHISNTEAKKNLSLIIKYNLDTMYSSCDLNDLASFLELEEKEEEYNIEDFSDYLKRCPEYLLLAVTYLNLDTGRETYYDWNAKYFKNGPLDRVYDMLLELGYEMSDEEKALKEGTHQLFQEA